MESIDYILIGLFLGILALDSYLVWKVAYGRGLLDGDEAANLIQRMIPPKGQPAVNVGIFRDSAGGYRLTITLQEGSGRPALREWIAFSSAAAASEAAKRYFPHCKPKIVDQPPRD